MQRLLFLVFVFSGLFNCYEGQTTQTPNYYCTDSGQPAQFTFSTANHSARKANSNCSLSQCANGPNVNSGCRSSSTPCFEYLLMNNTIVCAPAIQCSIVEPCNNITNSCSSNTSICVINSCCSTQAVCLPAKATSFCRTGWLSTGSLNVSRYGHSAFLLPNGKVLVIGGRNSGTSYIDSTEIYDPSTGLWSIAMNLNLGRYGQATGVLPNGYLFVAGGLSVVVEVYDPSTEIWSFINGMSAARCYFTTTVLANGQILAAGGYNAVRYLNTAEFYDPSTGNWVWTPNMTTTRGYHTDILLPNGKVLVSGGVSTTAGPTPINSSELYDPVTGTWVPTGSMREGRTSHTLSLLMNGKVLAVGGSYSNTAELYDPIIQTWTYTGAMSFGRMGHTASILPNGKVLVIGGSSYTTTEIYDPSTGLWSTGGNITVARSQHTTLILPNGRVLIVGGDYGSTVLNTAELF